MICGEKARRQIGRKCDPRSKFSRWEIDGVPRKREATPESAVWQATSRKSARNGAPPVVFVLTFKENELYFAGEVGHPAKGRLKEFAISTVLAETPEDKLRENMSSRIFPPLCGLILARSFDRMSALHVKSVFVAFAIVTCAIFTPRFGGVHQTSRKPERPLGRRRRSLAFLAVASGLLTFFLPLVTTQPSVMGRTRWSPCDISWQIYAGNLPPSVPLMTTLVYLILVFALATLCMSPSRGLLAKIALFGLFAIGLWRGDRSDFELLFYGKFGYDNLSLIRHVGFGDLMIALIATMVALLYIALNENLDTGSSPKKATIGESSSGTREPGLLDVEILPPEEDDSSRRAPGHRILSD
jgi:hypothetical protein